MSTEENKAVITKFFNGLSKGDLGVFDEFLSEKFIRHGVGMPDMDKEGYKQLCLGMGVFPNTTIDDMVADGDKVAFRVSHEMRHTASIMGVPPTGKTFTIAEYYIGRFEVGKVAEWWCLPDMLGLYQNLGITPPTG